MKGFDGGLGGWVSEWGYKYLWIDWEVDGVSDKE